MSADLMSPVPPVRPRAFIRWFWHLIKEIVDDYRRDGAGDLAAAITFWTVLSIPAAALALISGLSSLDSIAGSSVAEDVRQRARDFIADQFVNSAALTDAVDELFGSSNRGIATIATLVAIFTLSRAFAGLIRSLDAAYGVEDGRRWWHARLVAIGLGIGTLVVVASAATVLALLPALPIGSLGRFLTVPIVLVALTMWAATVYHIGPNHRTPWRFDLPGAIVTALGWAITTQGFAFYVRFSGGRNQLQSTVGAILLALTLMYFLSLVMIVGAELNEIISRRAGVVQQPASVREMADQLRARVNDRLRTDDDIDADAGTTGEHIPPTADDQTERPADAEPTPTIGRPADAADAADGPDDAEPGRSTDRPIDHPIDAATDTATNRTT